MTDASAGEDGKHREEKVFRLRSNLSALAHLYHFNQGSCAPVPLPAQEALLAGISEETRSGRVGPNAYPGLRRRMRALREHLETLIAGAPGSVALTHRTTDGMNVALLGQPWQSGDVLLTTSLEHVGGVASVPLLRERFGVVPRIVDVGLGESDRVLASLEDALRREPRARLLVASHVAYSTGAVLPIRQMASLCHAHGVRIAVDGAQSVGAIPTSVTELGVDYLAFPAQKWLFGPEGLGGLYVSPEVLRDTFPPVSGGASFSEEDTTRLHFTFHPDARRFEVGTSMHHPSVQAFEASLGWLESDVGLPWLFSRVERVARSLRQRSEALGAALKPITPEGGPSGLLVLASTTRPAEDLVQEAYARRIVIRSVPPNAIRISASFFHTEADLEVLFAWLREAGVRP